MSALKEHATVRVHYTVRLENGTILGTTKDQDPLEFTVGEGEVLPSFEKAVLGMNPGESKTVVVSADQAFGPHLDEMVIVVDRLRLPEGLDPKRGDMIRLQVASGEIMNATVTDVSEATVTLDCNHPLAGKDLIFDIDFLEVVQPGW